MSLVFLFLLTLVWSTAPGSAQEAPSAKQQINIAFVEIENDSRYAPVRAYERIILKTRAHPLTGAELGLDDAAPLARVLKADFHSQRITVKSAAEVAPSVRAALDSKFALRLCRIFSVLLEEGFWVQVHLAGTHVFVFVR